MARPKASEDKELTIRIAHNTMHYEFCYGDSGGEVPQMLKGLYTDPMAAERDKARYLAGRDREKRAYKHPNPKKPQNDQQASTL